MEYEVYLSGSKYSGEHGTGIEYYKSLGFEFSYDGDKNEYTRMGSPFIIMNIDDLEKQLKSFVDVTGSATLLMNNIIMLP